MKFKPASVNIEIRREIRPGDRKALEALLESAGIFHAYEIAVALELFDDRVAKGEASEYHFLLADREGALAGYVCFGPITVTDQRYDLYWIGVHRQWHGQGIGRQLLEAAEQAIRAAGGRYIYVETSSRPCYEPTRQFYLARSYQEVARVPYYYADDDDRVIYLKRLE